MVNLKHMMVKKEKHNLKLLYTGGQGWGGAEIPEEEKSCFFF